MTLRPVVVLLAAAFAPSISAQSKPKPPRLVVLCAVDQLARWVLDEALPFCGDGGFKRLQREGVTFANCAYLHGCTETGPGHATLGTGAPACAHGIAHNEWFDSATGKPLYCVSEPVPALPEFPEGKDRGPGLLLVPTLGDLLKEHAAAAKVVSVSVKDRAAILMGGARADAVVWFEVATGRFVTNTRWGRKAPAWLLAFDAGKPADALFGWNWDRCAPDAAYDGLVDDQHFEMPHPSSGARTLPVALTGKKGNETPGGPFYFELFLSPLGNVLTLQAAEAAVAGEQLGRDDVPDLLCVSFSATDLVGHMFGPESVEARDTVLRFDALLAQLLEFLDRDVGAGRYAFLLSADHGVGHTPAWVKAHGGTGGNVLLHTYARAAAEKALQEHFGPAAKGPFVASALEFSLVLDRAAVTAAAAAPGNANGNADADAAFRRACEVAAAGASKGQHVQCAFVTEDLLAHPGGDDPVRRAMAYAACRGRSGDVMLVFEPNWIEGPIAATHGSPFDYDTQVPLLAMGPGLARGARIDAQVSPGLMVVLASALLGVERPKAAGEAIPDGAMGR